MYSTVRQLAANQAPVSDSTDDRTIRHQFDSSTVKALPRHQASGLIEKYPDDLELWNRFWSWCNQQCQNGMPAEVAIESSEILERVWRESGRGESHGPGTA